VQARDKVAIPEDAMRLGVAAAAVAGVAAL
jgi:hypothetical protein